MVFFNLLIPFHCTYFAGPNTNMRDVRFSGTDVDAIVTVPAVGPATVTFNITDDTVTGEDDETYPLFMVATNTTVVIQQHITTIIITDNVDRMLLLVHY